MVDTILSCPLGHECEKIGKHPKTQEDVLIRCRWYQKMRGVSPSGEEIDRDDCVMAWLPVMLQENARQTLGVNAALSDFKNEVVEANSLVNVLQVSMDKSLRNDANLLLARDI